MKALGYVIAAIFYVGIGAMYAGIGWIVAWILEAGLDIAVNYSLFVWIAVGIFFIKTLPVLFLTLLSKKEFSRTKNTFDIKMKLGKK